MDNLDQEQVINMLNTLLGEDIREEFETQLKEAGEHGNPSFIVANSGGSTAEVFVEWNKEGDYLSYSINEDYQAE
ncbi:hypothetical protein SAMN05216389_105188 [Oceanobacillus limi]|uniref:Uncharacterized protein n=1 Tax=Oceanobacillus limi TaxID=930131 RepID=A0A1I0BUD8_9BACI|nr:hypothetical protein [Oceanobacillus limi]SET10667.1 hypothetical protein SAMN05216389_105188 [Oceanobacillus limi]